jgi:hypothetical protein
MFHKEFYPTPVHVLEMMQINCENKTILEPHAGKGNIIDYCNLYGAKEILSFEINEDLQKIVRTKSKLIGSDFFECKAEQISHIDLIVMNPPFSNADKHILHAWKTAPEGCEIIALCNYETIRKSYTSRELVKIINDYGTSESLGDCFSTAERKTGVEVGLVKLFKPVVSSTSDFEGFFMDEDEEELQAEGIMQFNEVRALVNRYVAAVKSFDAMQENVNYINSLVKPVGLDKIKMELGYNNSIVTREDFSKTVQRSSWQFIFSKMKMDKYVTSGVMQDINKFVETQTKIPFTMKNIYRMFEIIVGTRGETFNRALEEVIDKFTKHTHENRFGVEGWKSNSGYMLNKKFIVENVAKVSYSNKLEIPIYSVNFEKLKDLTKVLCNITGENFDSIETIEYSPCDLTEKGYLTVNGCRVNSNIQTAYNDRIMWLNDFRTNTWYKWGFFEFKVFKKGTIHLKFIDNDVWYRLNKAYGELKGFSLPETYKK